MITDQDSEIEMVQVALLQTLEELHDTLTKEEKDGLIMLYIQKDLLR